MQLPEGLRSLLQDGRDNLNMSWDSEGDIQCVVPCAVACASAPCGAFDIFWGPLWDFQRHPYPAAA